MTRPAPPPWDSGPPVVRVHPSGRWAWRLIVVHGLVEHGFGRIVYGRARADRIAGRMLARYQRRTARQGWTVS